jgi:ubiquinone/menaquinone biosynthesis C-methylase UbiE
MSETNRIVNVYKARIESRLIDRYSLFFPGELYMSQRREEESLRLLARSGVRSLRDMRVLDVGCGRGTRVPDWMKWGASPSSIFGIDLLEPFISEARQMMPGAHFLIGSAGILPFQNGCFDLVIQSTMFTSILNSETKRQIAGELLRVAKPGGLILWYDFRYPNIKNPDVRPIRIGELKSLFPQARLDVVSLTLLPPLARRLAPLSAIACRILERCFPFLRSHYLALIHLPGDRNQARHG